MQEERQKAQVQVPRLALDGSNWVIYHDRLKWVLQISNFNDHSLSDSPSAAYIALGDVRDVTLNDH